MTFNGKVLKKVWVWMDVSAACNLACRDCYTKAAHASVLMSPSQFREALEKLASPLLSVQKLHLNWRGEPLINKKLPDILKIKAEVLPSVPLELHTNGLLLDKSVSHQILEHLTPADLIYVSIDGGSRQLHEANRGPDTWLPALRALKAILDAREGSLRSRPRIGIYEICYGNPRCADPQLIALSRRCDEWTRVDPISGDGQEASFAGAIPKGACFWAGNALCITAAGDVHVCLLSFRPEGCLGNIFLDDPITIVIRAENFRRSLAREGRFSVAHCYNCKKTEGDVDEP